MWKAQGPLGLAWNPLLSLNGTKGLFLDRGGLAPSVFSPEGQRDQCPEAAEGQREEFGEKEQQTCGARGTGSRERRQTDVPGHKQLRKIPSLCPGCKGALQSLPRGVGRTGGWVSGLWAWQSQRTLCPLSAHLLLTTGPLLAGHSEASTEDI